jgi:hypothetical protein
MGIASGAKAIPSLIGGISSLFGGGGGGGDAGLSPEEAALMQYQRHESILRNNSFAASTGTGMGTGVSFEDAAAGIGAATTGAGIVDKQLAAQMAVQQANLQSLAQSAGFGTQSGGGGGGSNVNPTPDVSAV